jgi:hypothetical protein
MAERVFSISVGEFLLAHHFLSRRELAGVEFAYHWHQLHDLSQMKVESDIFFFRSQASDHFVSWLF